MTLYFISIGLWDERDMSLRALEVARSCDFLFLELYTQPMNTTKEKLEKLIGKRISKLSRKDLEENYEQLLDLARTKRVGLLVGGDAFCATTHAMLRVEATKRGVETRVIHGSSVFSAVAECGLHMYKFGATATLPLPERVCGLPYSVYEKVRMNKMNGLHTLLLLDIDVENDKFLTPREAMKTLLEMERTKGCGVFKNDTYIIVLSRLGSERTEIAYGKVRDLVKLEFKLPAVIVVPGDLHFTEEEYLNQFLTI